MNLQILSSSDWSMFSEKAHLVVFNKIKPSIVDRIDFAIVAESDGDLCGYITAREHDDETIYWAWGGMFPGSKGTTRSYRAYQMAYDWTLRRYSRILTMIENTNTVMLKFALTIGFQIIGVKHIEGSTYVEMMAVKHGS